MIVEAINFFANKDNVLYRSMFKNLRFETALDICISYARVKLEINTNELVLKQEHEKFKKRLTEIRKQLK